MITPASSSICSATSRGLDASSSGLPHNGSPRPGSEGRNMKARIEWIEGRVFLGTSNSGHGIVIAAPTAPGAVTIAPSPMEYVLLGTGGCTATDVVMILEKGRHDVRGVRGHAGCRSPHGRPEGLHQDPLSLQGHRQGPEARRGRSRDQALARRNTAPLRSCWPAAASRSPTISRSSRRSELTPSLDGTRAGFGTRAGSCSLRRGVRPSQVEGLAG